MEGMKDRIIYRLSRRSFLASASGIFAAGSLIGLPRWGDFSPQEIQKLPESLSPKEQELIKDSVMAKDLANYFGKGYSCAESILMVSLRFLGKSEDQVWAAAGFGGGIYHKDLCGFLTGGVMGLGFASGMLKKERKDAKEDCKNAVNQYWTWWESMAPLHCSEIRTPERGAEVCRRLGQLASAQVEQLVRTMKIEAIS